MKIAPSKNRFNLSAWALENPQMVSFFMLLIMVIGSLSYTLLPRNEDPAFTIKTAVVSAQWPGASVTDTTHLVTDVLEKNYRKRPGSIISSETRAGQTVIYINLRDDTRRTTSRRSGTRSAKNAGYCAIAAGRRAGTERER
ncbi:MAG: efflux RND transporter permease subunit [Enterobacteriaceae bacterium]